MVVFNFVNYSPLLKNKKKFENFLNNWAPVRLWRISPEKKRNISANVRAYATLAGS